jgi:hypothetical protein
LLALRLKDIRHQEVEDGYSSESSQGVAMHLQDPPPIMA